MTYTPSALLHHLPIAQLLGIWRVLDKIRKLATLVLDTLNIPILCPSPTQNIRLLQYPASSLPLTFCFVLFSGKGLFLSGENSSAEIYIPIFSLQWGFVS